MRRLTNPRIRATSTTADILILCILLIQCALGLTTIPSPPSIRTAAKCSSWWTGRRRWSPSTAAPRRIWTVSHGFTASTVLGMTIFLIFPSPGWFTSGARRWNISPGVTGGTLPALSAGGVTIHPTGSPDEAFAPSSGIYRTLGFMPGGGYALSGLQGLSQAHTSQARAGAPPGKISTRYL